MLPHRPCQHCGLQSTETNVCADLPHVQNQQSGGGLLMITAPGTANNSAPIFSPASLGRQRQGNSTKPFAVNDGTDNAVLGEEGFQPFLQLAFWGHGSFNPLARFSSDGLLLGGGSEGGDGAGEGSWSESPPGGTATRLKARMEHNPTDNDRMHAIRTRHGGLEVASAAGEWYYRTKQQRQGLRHINKGMVMIAVTLVILLVWS